MLRQAQCRASVGVAMKKEAKRRVNETAPGNKTLTACEGVRFRRKN